MSRLMTPATVRTVASYDERSAMIGDGRLVAGCIRTGTTVRPCAQPVTAIARAMSRTRRRPPRRPAHAHRTTLICPSEARADYQIAAGAELYLVVIDAPVKRASNERVVVEVLAGGHERYEMVLQRAGQHVGDALGRPPLGVVHAHDRPLVAEQHDLLAAHAENLAGDLLCRLGCQKHGDGRDVLGAHALD